VKGSIVLGHSDYQYAHEPILYGYTAGSGRPGRARHPGTHWYGDNGESSVLEYRSRLPTPIIRPPSRSPSSPNACATAPDQATSSTSRSRARGRP
jgi:hypothetical protein